MVPASAEREARVAEMRRQQLLRDAAQRRFITACAAVPGPRNVPASRRPLRSRLYGVVGLLVPSVGTRSAAIVAESAATRA